jgi:hypothetical protein
MPQGNGKPALGAADWTGTQVITAAPTKPHPPSPCGANPPLPQASPRPQFGINAGRHCEGDQVQPRHHYMRPAYDDGSVSVPAVCAPADAKAERSIPRSVMPLAGCAEVSARKPLLVRPSLLVLDCDRPRCADDYDPPVFSAQPDIERSHKERYRPQARQHPRHPLPHVPKTLAGSPLHGFIILWSPCSSPSGNCPATSLYS